MSVKEGLKRIPGLRSAVRFARERIIDVKAMNCFLSERRYKREDGPVKVGFFCQYIPAWMKMEDLYNMMRQDTRFEPYLLCVPYGIKANELINPNRTENDAYDYCKSHGYKEAINTLIRKNTWLDLKELKLDYVIYSRPYNSFMPRCYTTHEISKFSKVCLIMYGMELSEETAKIALNRDFMAFVYCFFADSNRIMMRNIKNNKMLHMLGLQKTICTGNPIIEKMYNSANAIGTSWDFSRNTFRVIWTPRWTTDPSVGGTNFFKYRNTFFALAGKYPEIDFLFRPHPLALPNFVEKGEMTDEEVTLFQNRCDSTPNISLDYEKVYAATFWQSSVLVSDISSIIPEYFITGKPIIFCDTNMELQLASYIKRILEGCYIVKNESELEQCLLMLKLGEDPLKEKRQIILEEVLPDRSSSICDKIMEAMQEKS